MREGVNVDKILVLINLLVNLLALWSFVEKIKKYYMFSS